MKETNRQRRRFFAAMAAAGFGASVLPQALWAQIQDAAADRVTPDMMTAALNIAGVKLTDDDQKALLQTLNRNLTSYEEIRALKIPNDVSPPYHFSPIVAGMKINRTREPLRFSKVAVKRPANLEDVAFWPVSHLAHLLRTKQVTSMELTDMYLARLHKYNDKLNCVVTFLDDVAHEQAKKADAEIASGHYKGPLHGIPWGAKDIISVKGFKTTWGSGAYKDQQLDYDASVVEMLRDAGAVLLAKLTTGELAGGDNWFGGQTKNPWDTSEGSSGSSAGPSSATAAGCCAFAIGTETSGSILSPTSRCGLTGLRPTFGRVSRYGVMALSWTQDRLGPICRYVEDCALVMSVIAKPDDRDMSVSEIPFNYNAAMDVKKLKVGYLKAAFDDMKDERAKANAMKALDKLRSLGINLVEVKMPEWTIDLNGYNVESAAFFEDLILSGRYKQMTNLGRANGYRSARAVPAVEYLQSQRARMMMMQKLSEATAAVDVYVTPAIGGGGPPAPRGAERAATPPPAFNARNQSAAQRHFSMANLACYPALNMPWGFRENGSPDSVTFYARPFGEAELLALGRVFQDASGQKDKHPNLNAAPATNNAGA